MREAQEQPPEIKSLKHEIENSAENAETNDMSPSPSHRQYKRWLQTAIYAFFVVAGQSVGTLLGRLYFNNGGKSKWMATLVQVVGFPVLLPFQWITNTKHNHNQMNTKKHILMSLASFYVAIGIFLALDCMLCSIGLQYLPVTTFTLISASQLGFNALFSYFLNRQKFTPYIVNSLVLLTMSSVLLVFQTDPGDSNKTSKQKYIIGFLCSLAAFAGCALMLSLTQLAFQKIIKRETVKAITDMTMYQYMVATFVVVIGIFASGDWKKINREMEEYESGKVSYVMNLFWTAVSWQVFGVGVIGLIFKVSSLFSNLIIMLGLPVGPILAVIFLDDKLTGLKAVSLLLAMWGSLSYIYQHYLDGVKMEKKRSSVVEVSEVALVNETG